MSGTIGLQLPYGEHIDSGELIQAVEAANGLKCHCICPGCSHPLEAVHPKSSSTRSYFRHSKSASNLRVCSDPVSARETIVHRLTKEFIASQESLTLPAVTQRFSEYKGHTIERLELVPKKVWQVANGRCEDSQFRPEFIPDVAFETEFGTLIVEVCYSNRVQPKKVGIIAEAKICSVELDVSDLTPENWQGDTIVKRLSTTYVKWLTFNFNELHDEMIASHIRSQKQGIDRRLNEEEKKKKERELELAAQQKAQFERMVTKYAPHYEHCIKEIASSMKNRYAYDKDRLMNMDKIDQSILSLRNELDRTFPRSIKNNKSQQLETFIRKQVIETRYVLEKIAILDEIAKEYSDLRMDEELRKLLQLGWRGESPGDPKSHAAKPVIENITESVKRFLEVRVSDYGLLTTEQYLKKRRQAHPR